MLIFFICMYIFCFFSLYYILAYSTYCLCVNVDVNSNPSRGLASGAAAPLLLILGYANGIQVWMIPVSIFSQTHAIF